MAVANPDDEAGTSHLQVRSHLLSTQVVAYYRIVFVGKHDRLFQLVPSQLELILYVLCT